MAPPGRGQDTLAAHHHGQGSPATALPPALQPLKQPPPPAGQTAAAGSTGAPGGGRASANGNSSSPPPKKSPGKHTRGSAQRRADEDAAQLQHHHHQQQPQPAQEQQQQGGSSEGAGAEHAAAAAPPPSTNCTTNPIGFLHSVLDEVIRTDKERYFIHPVDERGAPNYYSIIKAPMCFSVMQQKLDARAYTSWRAFVADFEQIVTNARTYNTNKTRCYKCAQTLQRNLNKILGQHELDIRKAFTALYPATPTTPAGGSAAAGLRGAGSLQLLPPSEPAGPARTPSLRHCASMPSLTRAPSSMPPPPAPSASLSASSGSLPPQLQHQLSLQPTLSALPSTALPEQQLQPLRLRASCGLQLTVPGTGMGAAAPPTPLTPAPEPTPQPQQQPPARRAPICDHISDEEDELQHTGHPLLPLEALLAQLRMPAQRQPWPAATDGQASAGPSAAAAQRQQQQQEASSSGRSSEWKAVRRPLEWQCHWLELRRRELLAQQQRLEAALQQQQQSQPGGEPASTPAAALAKQQLQLASSTQRFLGHATLTPPPPAQQPASTHSQQQEPPRAELQPPLASTVPFFQVRAGRAQLPAAQQHSSAAQPALQGPEPMAVDSQTQPQGAAGHAETAAGKRRRGRAQQQQRQQLQELDLQGITEATLPAALFSGFEALQQQAQSVRQSLHVSGSCGSWCGVGAVTCTRSCSELR